MPQPRKGQFEYDVCLSFAGKDRGYVQKVAAELNAQGIRVFYDEYEKHLSGVKIFMSNLHVVYSELARYCVIFISKHYGKKLWTNHEREVGSGARV